MSDAEIVDRTLAELAEYLPAARGAKLLHTRVHRIPMAWMVAEEILGDLGRPRVLRHDKAPPGGLVPWLSSVAPRVPFKRAPARLRALAERRP